MATNRAYAGKGLSTLSLAELAKLDKGLAPSLGGYAGFVASYGLEGQPWEWTWVGDVPTRAGVIVWDAYMQCEAVAPVIIRHPRTGVQVTVGAWAAEHCFGILDIPAQRQSRLAHDAKAIDAVREKDPLAEGFGDGLQYYDSATIGAWTGNVGEIDLETGEDMVGEAARRRQNARAWKRRFTEGTAAAVAAERSAAMRACGTDHAKRRELELYFARLDGKAI